MKKYNYIVKISINPDEGFWGGCVDDGVKMPLTDKSDYAYDCAADTVGNPYTGLLVSNKGRYAYFRGASSITVHGGMLTVSSYEDIVYKDGFDDFRSAYLDAAKEFFDKDELSVPKELLLKPQFCTWTECGVNVTADKTINYANSISRAGYSHGVIIIDDGWMNDYGDWTFNSEKFPDPAKTIKTLHEAGFKVMLWVVPFVNKTAKDYNLLLKNNALIRDESGNAALKTWWNGRSALLDMTSEFAVNWLKKELNALLALGADGFKFDAGGVRFYSENDVNEANTDVVGESRAYADFAYSYHYTELKECVNFGGGHAVTRLRDKRRNFDLTEGLGALVPNMIQSGICGYFYCCADMIGGGQISDFISGKDKTFDYETISRFCECSALMPCMQFSHAYWNMDENVKELFAKYVALHDEVSEYIKELISAAEKHREPILRSLEYVFPHQGFYAEKTAFMLGNRYLVAPVTEQGKTQKTVTLPKGKWLYLGKTGYTGGKTVTVPAPVGTLPYFVYDGE